MTKINITPHITRSTDSEKIRHGLVFGKFMPPTNGHLYMLDFARQSCDKLTIVVLTLEGEPIPGALRYEWIRKLYPDCTVVHHPHDMPQEPRDKNDIAFYHAWRDTLRKHCPQDDFTALFASESYGYQVAWALGIPFIPVDTARGAVQISGTKMRDNPWQHWEYLHPVVRPYFLKRVAFWGGDATQREELAAAMAADYQTRYVADYTRTAAADFKRNIDGWTAAQLTAADFATFLRGQKASGEALAAQANRVLFYASTLQSITDTCSALYGNASQWMQDCAADEKYDIIIALPGAINAPEGSLHLSAATVDAVHEALAPYLPPALAKTARAAPLAVVAA